MAVFNTVEQMLAQLRAGEDGRAEFKELRLRDRRVVAPNADDLAGELVAFANAEGGAVFVSIADSGVVQGIPPERVDLVEQWLLNVATHNCDPPIRPVIRKALLPAADGADVPVLLAEVPRRPSDVRRALLREDRVHEAGPHAAGARPAVPAAGPRVRVRRAAGTGRVG